jgi:hypothetical protein
MANVNLTPAYKGKLLISEAKKRDLLSLCKSGIIPNVHHPYYHSLASSQSIKDKLSEPDKEEEVVDTDVEN